MKPIFLHNTLTKHKDLFKPLNEKEVTMYSCGPTVYNYLHIGNLRAYVFADILKRTLKYNGFAVKQIMNVTDIGHLTSDADEGEDKMVKALKREGKPQTLEGLKEVGKFYFEKAKEDMRALNNLPADEYPFASDEIPAQVEMIEKLLEKGFAYKISDGIYYDTSQYMNYGVLGGVAKENESEMESRIGVNAEKKNPRDFALWKFADEGGIGFNSSLGKGFPGWHIECSAMAMKYLGEEFDIHTGGIDHIPVHHNNEIAQSESLTGKIPARFWLHNEHITISDEKMAKSGDNFLTLEYLRKNGVDHLAYRYWLLSARYSTRMDYSLDAIKASQIALEKLVLYVRNVLVTGDVNEEYKVKFLETLNDDLNTPKAIAIVWELMKDQNISDEDKKATLLDFDKVLGLALDKEKVKIDIPEEVQMLLDDRKTAKENKDFAQADEIRKNIENKGFFVKDNKDGNQELTNS